MKYVTQARAFQIHRDDNVATLVDDFAGDGLLQITGGFELEAIQGKEPIKAGHKVALRRIGKGEVVIKFGSYIGCACQCIEKGSWVHLHNIQSKYDERSGSFDLNTGVPLETVYR